MGNPEDYKTGIIRLEKGQVVSRNALLYQLVQSLYSRTETDFKRGTFRVKGDTVDVHLPYLDYGYRVIFLETKLKALNI